MNNKNLRIVNRAAGNAKREFLKMNLPFLAAVSSALYLLRDLAQDVGEDDLCESVRINADHIYRSFVIYTDGVDFIDMKPPTTEDEPISYGDG